MDLCMKIKSTKNTIKVNLNSLFVILSYVKVYVTL